MTDTGLQIFDRTLQTSHSWLNEINQRTGRQDRQLAYAALRSSLHALRDRLTLEEATHLGAQLPTLVRGIYYEGWNAQVNPRKDSREEFLEQIRNNLAEHTEIQPEEACRAVFSLLDEKISAGEIDDVRDTLPDDFAGLFEKPEPVSE